MDETPNKENEARAHVAMLGRMTAWGGWILALGSLILGQYLLNKMHQEIIGMQQENKNLQVSLSESRERLQKHIMELAEKRTADKKSAAGSKKAPR
jgi:hypothetical protein